MELLFDQSERYPGYPWTLEFRQFCMKVVEDDIAAVTITLGSPVLMTSIRAKKTTFAEQLATFGKKNY